MLPTQNRLKKKKDFEKIFKKGKGFRENFLFFKIVPNNQEVSRFAFMVSQKISKKAVVRNKVKRRLRELVRLKLPQIEPGIDGVFVALPGIETQSFETLERTIAKLFKKAKIFQPPKRKG